MIILLNDMQLYHLSAIYKFMEEMNPIPNKSQYKHMLATEANSRVGEDMQYS